MSRVPSSEPETEENPIIESIREFIQSIRNSCVKLNCTVNGQHFIEGVRDVPIVVGYCSRSNGNWMAWFLLDEHFSFMALVNESMKHVMKVHQSQMDRLQETLNTLKDELE